MMQERLGVDIGGTKIGFCTVSAEMEATPLDRVSTALLRRGTTAFADDLANLIRTVKPPSCNRVGVSLNAVINAGVVPYSSLMGGRVDFPLETFLNERLGCPVRLDDDIHAMTLAEAHLGASKDVACLAMLNIGTGIGVGCFAGTVLRGQYAAGLISEQLIYVEELGALRSLDRTVCGRGIREVYQSLGGEDVDAITVFARARSGEEIACRTVSIFAKYLGYVLQLISRFYHPQRIVINGSIRHAAPDFLPSAVEAYRTGIEAAFLAEVSISNLEHAAEIGVLMADPHTTDESRWA